jgi:hypothetical protein
MEGGGAHISGLNQDLLSAVQMFKKLHFFSENTLAGPYFFLEHFEKFLPGHSKSLGGPKMARGPRVGRPCFRQ